MPDHNNPWGNNSNNNEQNPWGGNRRNNPPPPDIDEILKKAQENLSGMFPGNLGGGLIIAAGIIVIIALWFASGFYTVKPGEQGVVQRFGAWERTQINEGLDYHLPYPIEKVTIVNVSEIRRMEIGFSETINRYGQTGKRDIPEESLMLTSDANIVDLDMVVQWNIKSAEEYLFNIKDPEHTIKKVAESAIREIVGQTEMFPIITKERDQVALRAKQIMIDNLEEYKAGVKISQVLIQKAEVHPEVQAAFQDVQSAKQDAEDVQNKAIAYREDIIPKAKGLAIKMIQEAQGYKESVIAKATGDAKRFESVYASYKNDKDVTRERMYIETMEKVLSNAEKIILDNKDGQGVVPYLPINEIGKKK